MKKDKNNKYQYDLAALRMALIYIFISSLWILFSDRLLLNNPDTVVYVSTIKGWIYTLVVGILIFFALSREFNKLKKATEQYKLLFYNMINGFAYHKIIFDENNKPVDYKFLEVNPVFEKMTGLVSADIIGKKVTEVIPGIKDDSINWIGRYSEVALTGQGVRFENYSKALKKWFAISAYSSKKGYFVTIFEDITVRKENEQKLKELDKLKDNFLSVTTHELKTPLIPIKSQTQLLLEGDYGPLNLEQKKAIEMIARNEENLNRLTSELMDISKIKSNKLSLILEDVAMDEILSDTVKDLDYLAKEKNITVILEPITNEPTVMADKQKITQVLHNIISNAIKFTPDNGKVFINFKKADKEIFITVKDNGIGVSEVNLKKLFTPFFQVQNDLNRKYRGTGLGLAITQGIISAHGGKIWAESDGENKGTSLIFSLPLK